MLIVAALLSGALGAAVVSAAAAAPAAPAASAASAASKSPDKPAPPPVRRTGPPVVIDGTCAYSTLASDAGQLVTEPSDYDFTQPNVFWSAVGIRPEPDADWDVAVYDTAGVGGACVSDSLAGSNRPFGQVDVVVGDFNHMDLKTYYARATHVGGEGAASIEWDDGPDLVIINGYPTQRSMSGTDVVDCFDVHLFAGTNYSFSITSTGGTGKFRLYAFRNPASAAYWATLDDAIVELPATTDGALVNYTATVTDWYGLIVVNENSEAGSYRLEANTCFGFTVLVNGVTRTASDSPTPYKLTQLDAYWTAVGVRGSGETQAWDLSLWQSYATDANEPCFTGPIAASGMGLGKVDVVAIDYNNVPLGSAYVRAFPTGTTNTPSTVQWDAGANLLTVGAPATTQTTGASHVVKIWDVALEEGHVYQLEVSAQSTVGGPVPECRAILFRNHNGAAAYAAGRQEADLETSSSGPYAAPATGRYGVAVVNDNAAVGEYTIRVAEADMVGVPGPGGAGAFVTRVVGLRPNPIVAGAVAHVAFELARPGRVAFELVDVAGRVRMRSAEMPFGAGPAVTTWAMGAGEGGAGSGSGPGRAGRAPAGVHFLRMIVDGHPAGAVRVVTLAGAAP